MWQSVLSTLGDEFADLADPQGITRFALRLLVAVVLAAVVGYEREMRGSSAGLRTHMLVALGVTLIIVTAEQSGIEPADMSRVLQGIFAGIGFLGAGAIIKQSDKDQVRGLTTAASIWATAGIATAAGLGHAAMAALATALVYLILSLLLRFERRMVPKTSVVDDPSLAAPEDEKRDAGRGPR